MLSVGGAKGDALINTRRENKYMLLFMTLIEAYDIFIDKIDRIDVTFELLIIISVTRGTNALKTINFAA